MKYSLPKKIIYSIIVAVLLVGLVLTAFFGLNGKGYGSTYDIDLGLDLAGGVSITYQIKEDNFTSQDVEDTIYKLQKRVEGKSTESQVYKEGDNRITVEIPGVTDANEILKDLMVFSLHLQMMVLLNSMMQHQLILVTEYILYMTEKL